jgi:hypothetical protein
VEPDNPFEWMRWVDTGSLMWIDGVFERWNLGIEPTAEERAQWLTLEADAIRRMLSSVPASGRAVMPLLNDPR